MNDLTPVLERLDALTAMVERLARRQAAQDELIADMTPIARSAIDLAIDKLDALDKAGAFGVIDTLRALTSRDLLDAAPLGMLGVARAARKDDDVRKGLAIVVEMLRRLGHRANATPRDRGARLAAMLGPRRVRAMLPAPAVAPASAPSCAPASPSAAADPDWTRDKAARTAPFALTDAHWAVIDAARADYAAKSASPNIRRLTQITGITTKDLYTLFPKAPGRTIAAIAGLPKPAGCL